MRKSLVALLAGSSVLALIGLGGCASTGGLSPVAQADIAQIIATAQKVAVATCSVEPIAASIVQIVNQGDPSLIAGPAIAIGTNIANVICASVLKSGTVTSRARTVKFRGTVLRKPATPVIIDGVTVNFVS